MAQMNKLIEGALNAFMDNNFIIPNDNLIKKSLIMAGLNSEEVNGGSLIIGSTPLESIFSQIALYAEKKQTDKKWIGCQVLEPNVDSIPYPFDKIDVNYDKLIEQLKELKQTELISACYEDEEKALVFLEKYATYLSASANQPYLSFFDLIKNAAALYKCMDMNKNKPEFLLVGGDLSGIQNYLFNMSESQSKGVAKILRARSFRLGLFTEVSRHFILHSLDLPLYCTLVDAGGRFILLVPNNEKVVAILDQLEGEIQEFCLNHFNGELILNFAFSTSLNESDFNPNSLSNKFNELSCTIENKKFRPFNQELISDKWNTEKFVFGKDYDNYENDLCQISGYLPRKAGSDYSAEFENDRVIGRELVKSTFLGFQREKKKEATKSDERIIEFPFKSKKYYVHFIRDEKAIGKNEYYLVQNLEGKFNINSTPRFTANYVPMFDYLEFKDNCYFPFKNQGEYGIPLKEEEEFVPKKGDIVDFETIARSGVEKLKQDKFSKNGNHFVGTALLGVIKADVDMLGQIFMKGINHIFSLTSYSALSRQLDLFFTAYLPKIQEKKYKWIYTIYAGGDDLFFIGEWQEAIKFSKSLYEEFRKYTGDNLTLSTGIYIMQHNHPIRTAAELAEEMLDKAKNNNRDSLAIFDIVVKQDELEELMNLANFLDNRKKLPDTDSKINSAFLHRLLSYRKMAMKYLEEKNIEGLMYMSRLSYDIGRNLIEWDKNKKMTKGIEESKRLMFLTDFANIHKMEKMELPIFWSILKNRRI